MKFITACAFVSTAFATTPQEDLDNASRNHATNTPGSWKAGAYADSNRVGGSESAPPVCPVKCHYNGNTIGRQMAVIFDRHALAGLSESGWKCGLEVDTGDNCLCQCGGTERSVTVHRSCFEEWTKSDQAHMLHHTDGSGYHFLPSGQGFAGDNPLCRHDDAAGDGLRIKHMLNADLSGTTWDGSTPPACTDYALNTPTGNIPNNNIVSTGYTNGTPFKLKWTMTVASTSMDTVHYASVISSSDHCRSDDRGTTFWKGHEWKNGPACNQYNVPYDYEMTVDSTGTTVMCGGQQVFQDSSRTSSSAINNHLQIGTHYCNSEYPRMTGTYSNMVFETC